MAKMPANPRLCVGRTRPAQHGDLRFEKTGKKLMGLFPVSQNIIL
ncbi:hypothetical protein HMPREF9436_03024 [Faecalibacterium cf. prausnitzii KLE1255]|uniref:Uncharacterized protein n=1 Tax=Faecalibacterium cf. prausnitzii KLE1255 TaxID=748224 RepID=E2ZMU6_9FIRM|nr:hypothetical protein HMPREF9436_03024 [Faecalibacterium cf. prausnitzii KLE1255]